MKLTHLTKNDFLCGETSPLDKIIPEFIGQHYVVDDVVYIATKLDKNSWTPVQPLIDVSELGEGNEDLTKVINTTVKDVQELKPYVAKVDTNVKDISELKSTVSDLDSSQTTVLDIHNVVSETVDLKNYCSINEVNKLLLTYEAMCGDLLRRVKCLETENKVSCVRVTVPNDIKFTTSTPKILGVTISPTTTTDVVEYKSSNTEVATVKCGLITPVGNGKATISVTCGKSKADCTVVVDIPTEEEEEEIKQLLSTSEELYPVNGNITVPFVSEIDRNVKLKYLVWDLYYEGSILAIGTYKEVTPMDNIIFECSHLLPKTYSGVKLRAKKYNPVTREFEIVAISNDTTFEIKG